MKDTVYFIVISLIMVVMAYFVAFGCEKLIEKKTHVKFSSEKTKVNKLVIMAMLSAVAVVLMYFDFLCDISDVRYYNNISFFHAIQREFTF